MTGFRSRVLLDPSRPISTDPNPAIPRWNLERPFLTGRFHQEVKLPSQAPATTKPLSIDPFSRGSGSVIGSYPVSVQELLVIDDLLSALVGIEGRYISIKRVRGKEGHVMYQIDPSMDLALQELSQQIFPLCEDFVLISQFVESRSHFKSGLVNHAFAAALRALLLDYHATVAQLEHQFRLGRLSVQGLLFFCQSMMGSLHALSIVVEKASNSNLSGSATLNLLQSQAKAMAGDNAVRMMLEKMTQLASSAYLGILERWVYEGVINDPYGEFFIAENRALQKESLTQDYDAKYWKQRYSLKDGIPSFLTSVASMILMTGKYLNVMRECGHNSQVPISEKSKLSSFGAHHRYLESIKAAHEFASGELLNLIKEKYDLIGKLRSIKRYLLLRRGITFDCICGTSLEQWLESTCELPNAHTFYRRERLFIHYNPRNKFLLPGDFLVHFMDISRDELTKRRDEISVEKLQSLLDLALRTTAAAVDPCHENLACCVERTSLLKKLAALNDLESSPSSINNPVSGDDDKVEQGSITGLETFCLTYKVQWPLSLAISRKALTKYQLIFRFLFHCKHVSRQLCVAWQVHQGFRSVNTFGTAISQSSILCRSMLKFINSLLHYLTFEVLEPNWHLMHDRLQSAKSIDEVIQFHDLFLQKCLKECLLLMPQLLKKMEKLKSICLQYAASIQLLITSTCIPEPDCVNAAAASFGGEKSRPKRSHNRSQQLKIAAENTIISDSIRKFEKEFNIELQSLVPILSNNSQTEPYLTHLAQCILGVGSEH